MLIGFVERGGIDAAEHPVAPFGLGRGIAKRLGAYHPVEQGHQSISVQFGRNLHAYCAALTSIVQRTAFLALAAFSRHDRIAYGLTSASGDDATIKPKVRSEEHRVGKEG